MPRIAAIAARPGLSAEAVVADALENGHSRDWQERFPDRVEAGLAAVERGDFASADDIDRVLNRFRPD